MFHPAGHDEKLAFPEFNFPVAEFHGKFAPEHEEELIFAFVLMPDKRALKFDNFDLLAVQLTCNPRIPMVGEQGQFFFKINFLHV